VSAPGFDVPPVRPGTPLVPRVGRTPRGGDDGSKRRDSEQAPHESPDEKEPRPAAGDEHSGHKFDVEA